jgi:hypothetical protein
LIATFRVAGNVGFLMYLSDAFGYLGSVAVLLTKEFSGVQLSWTQFFAQIVLALAVIGGACLIASALYFHHRVTRRVAAAALAPV